MKHSGTHHTTLSMSMSLNTNEPKAISQSYTTGWLWDSKAMTCVEISAISQYSCAGWKTLTSQPLEFVCKKSVDFCIHQVSFTLGWQYPWGEPPVGKTYMETSWVLTLVSRTRGIRSSSAQSLCVFQNMHVNTLLSYIVGSIPSLMNSYVSSIKRPFLNIWVLWFFRYLLLIVFLYWQMPFNQFLQYCYYCMYWGDASVHKHTCHGLHVEVRG